MCIIAWENKHNYEGPVRIVCPEHHNYFNEIGGGGKAGPQPSLLLPSVVADAAAKTAASLVAPPPIHEVNSNTLHSSPAESTLTGLQHLPLPVPILPPLADHDYDIENLSDSIIDNMASTSQDETVEDDVDYDFDGIIGDSDNEGDEQELHLLAVARRLADDDQCDEIISVADAERIIVSTPSDVEVTVIDDIGEPSTYDANGDVRSGQMIGAPDGWEPPCAPDTFTGYQRKHDAPAEEDIDNPAGWSMYTFTPNFDAKNKYTFHTTPAGARVVRMNINGKRQVNGWEFHY